MPPRIGVVEPTGDHADGRRARAARALVRRAVDAEREARDDADPGGRQVGAELGGHADAVTGGRPRAHQRHRRSLAEHGRARPRRRGAPAPAGPRPAGRGYDGWCAIRVVMPSSACRSQIRATSCADRARLGPGAQPGHRGAVRSQQVAQGGGADGRSCGQRDRIGLFGQAAGGCGLTPPRPTDPPASRGLRTRARTTPRPRRPARSPCAPRVTPCAGRGR